MDNIVYVPTPVSVKPEKDGVYAVITEFSDEFSVRSYFNRSFTNYDGYKVTHWLRPVSASELLGEAWDAGYDYRQYLSDRMMSDHADAPDKEESIKSILNKH